MKNYLELLRRVLDEGEPRMERTGVGARSVFAPEKLEYNLAEGFPLVTTKKMFWRGVVAEMLWMVSGDVNVHPLQVQGVTIWDAWVQTDGDLGPVYGHQWRRWQQMDYGDFTPRHIDQLAKLVHALKENPTSRRHVVSAWNVADIDRMALPPCHYAFQCYVTNSVQLDLLVHMRSVDLFLGLPFNIAGYALLNHMLCRATGLNPGRLVMELGDAHIYDNHVDQVREQLQRVPFARPQLRFTTDAPTDLFAIRAEHIELVDYQHHPAIKAPVAV